MTASPSSPNVAVWGAPSGRWVGWSFALLSGGFGALVGGVVGCWLGWVLSFLLASPRSAEVAAWSALLFAFLGALVVGVELALRVWGKAGMGVELEPGGTLVIRGAWTRRLEVGAVEAARVIASDEGGAEALALVLSTRTRDVVIPARRVFQGASPELRAAAFEELTHSLEAWLLDGGIVLDQGVAASAVTAWHQPLRWWLMWPHRRWLLARARRWRSPERAAPDHTRRLPSQRWSWRLRSRPVLLLLAGVGLMWAWLGAGSPEAREGIGLLGLLSAPGLLAVNALVDLFLRRQAEASLTPESLIGSSALPKAPPERWCPAPGCEVDFGQQVIRRPDGRTLPFSAISGVLYGPASDAGARSEGAFARAQAATVWRLAATLRESPEHPVEIYGNASVDMVRYGDLDAGYAVFNWGLVRRLALACEAPLRLAHGRVAPAWLGRPLIERLSADPTRYDPEPMREALEARPLHRQVQLREQPDRFEAWGPLTRQPEAYAAPPIYKLLALLPLLALGALGWSLAGLLGGYLAARSLGELVASRHFDTPGFMMDADGVWVRGEHIAWSRLEDSTLMPVAPGPVAFCGDAQVAVVGHLGGSYYERAWVGCAAWRWLQRRGAPPGEPG